MASQLVLHPSNLPPATSLYNKDKPLISLSTARHHLDIARIDVYISHQALQLEQAKCDSLSSHYRVRRILRYQIFRSELRVQRRAEEVGMLKRLMVKMDGEMAVVKMMT